MLKNLHLSFSHPQENQGPHAGRSPGAGGGALIPRRPRPCSKSGTAELCVAVTRRCTFSIVVEGTTPMCSPISLRFHATSRSFLGAPARLQDVLSRWWSLDASGMLSHFHRAPVLAEPSQPPDRHGIAIGRATCAATNLCIFISQFTNSIGRATDS